MAAGVAAGFSEPRNTGGGKRERRAGLPCGDATGSGAAGGGFCHRSAGGRRGARRLGGAVPLGCARCHEAVPVVRVPFAVGNAHAAPAICTLLQPRSCFPSLLGAPRPWRSATWAPPAAPACASRATPPPASASCTASTSSTRRYGRTYKPPRTVKALLCHTAPFDLLGKELSCRTVCACPAVPRALIITNNHYSGFPFLSRGQGEDVVAGIRTPEPIDTLARTLPAAYQQLLDNCAVLEKHYKDMQVRAEGGMGGSSTRGDTCWVDNARWTTAGQCRDVLRLAQLQLAGPTCPPAR